MPNFLSMRTRCPDASSEKPEARRIARRAGMRAYDFAAGSIINDDRLTIAHERARLPTGTYRARVELRVSVREFWDCARACVRVHCVRSPLAWLGRWRSRARTCEDEIRYVLLSSALLHPSAPSPSSPLPPSLFMRFPEPFPGYGTLLRRFPRLLSSSTSPRPPPSSPSLFLHLSLAHSLPMMRVNKIILLLFAR